MLTLDLRGRDLIITPPENLISLPTPELLRLLFGTHLPADVRKSMGRDKRHLFLRTQPIHFTAVKRALRQQQTAFEVAFVEQPPLPFTPTLTVQARPYQEAAFTAWLAAGSVGQEHFIHTGKPGGTDYEKFYPFYVPVHMACEKERLCWKLAYLKLLYAKCESIWRHKTIFKRNPDDRLYTAVNRSGQITFSSYDRAQQQELQELIGIHITSKQSTAI